MSDGWLNTARDGGRGTRVSASLEMWSSGRSWLESIR